jgi:hypothetical protein
VNFGEDAHSLQLLLLTAALLGLITGWIAKKKGRSFVGYWAFGFLMFLVALPYVLLMRRVPKPDQSK